MRVVIASGKGGTGKTMVATNLAWLLAKIGLRTTYVDADVEAPNGHLFLHPVAVTSRRFSSPLPVLVGPLCSGCGACQRFCAFNAIVAAGDKVLVFPELCHGCGGCVEVCPESALHERPRESGTLLRGRAGRIGYQAGHLDVGEPRSAPLIEALLEQAPREGVVVVDAPPGTSCGAVAALRGADQVVLVTEPTPFGLHDLRLAVEMCRKLGCSPSVIVNRCDLGNDQVLTYLHAEAIAVLAEIPFDRQVSAAYARGELAATGHKPLREAMRAVVSKILVHDVDVDRAQPPGDLHRVKGVCP